ncbi:putative DNA-binding domain, KAT8 regulatory NSL complex subunit 2 [Dioscorea sansibarensis]
MGSASASKHHPPPARSLKRDPSAELLESLTRNLHPSLAPDPGAADPMDCGDEDEVLRTAAFLSREEVLRRRSRRLKRLAKHYKDQYWALLEEVKVRHRDYYWDFGKSPFVGEDRESGGNEGGAVEGSEERAKGGVGAPGLGFGAGDGGKKGQRERCGVSGCKAYAMPLTKFCHSHILLDGKQTLYKACSYVIKSAQSGQIICGKPVLRAAVPSLCPAHFQKAQKHVSQALKKAGLNVSSSSRPAPKFHIITAEYVRQIQAKRREALNTTIETVRDKDEKIC